MKKKKSSYLLGFIAAIPLAYAARYIFFKLDPFGITQKREVSKEVLNYRTSIYQYDNDS